MADSLAKKHHQPISTNAESSNLPNIIKRGRKSKVLSETLVADETNKPRQTGRVKKTKVPFDPSVNNYPKRRMTIYETPSDAAPSANKSKKKVSVTKSDGSSSSSSVATSGTVVAKRQICGICQRYENTNSEFVTCKECINCVHLNCLKDECKYFSQNELLSWLCSNCQTCVICYESSVVIPLYKCYSCTSSYHLECHEDNGSKPTIVHKQRFKCNQCRIFDETIKKTKFDPVDTTKRRVSKQRSVGFAGFTDTEIHEKKRFFVDAKIGIIKNVVQQQSQQTSVATTGPVEESANSVSKYNHSSMNWCFDSTENDSYGNIVPDASKWDYQQVYNYFAKYFPKEVVDVFRDQEIDGSTLLLFKRADVLRRLNLKLGPALRVFAHVLRLQTRNNDIRLTWM